MGNKHCEYNDNTPVVLSEYGAALLLADMEVGDGYNLQTDSPFMFYEDTCTIDGVELPCTKCIPNPNYIELTKEQKFEKRKAERIRVYNYLKENFPTRDYADRYKKEEHKYFE
ncbi:MAG: hypothetical protein ACLTDM_07100 [Clostridium butyricum]